MEAGLEAAHAVAEARVEVPPVVQCGVRGVQLVVDGVLEDATHVEHVVDDVLGLEDVGGVRGVEGARLVVGAGPQAGQGDAGRVPRQLALERRALDEHAVGVVAVDVADTADDVRVELTEVVGTDGGRVDEVARRQGDGEATQLDVLVGALVELAAVTGGAVGGGAPAEAAEVRPEVLAEAAVEATAHLDRAGQPRVEEQLEFGADTVLAVALIRDGGEVEHRALAALVAVQPLGVRRAANLERRRPNPGPWKQRAAGRQRRSGQQRPSAWTSSS